MGSFVFAWVLFWLGSLLLHLVDQSLRSSYLPMTSLAQFRDCHSCYDERSIDQKKSEASIWQLWRKSCIMLQKQARTGMICYKTAEDMRLRPRMTLFLRKERPMERSTYVEMPDSVYEVMVSELRVPTAWKEGCGTRRTSTCLQISLWTQ